MFIETKVKKMEEIYQILKEIEIMVRERKAAEDSLEYTNHQLEIYEEKAWDMVINQGRLSPEFQIRHFKMIKRRIDDLLEDQSKWTHKVRYLNANLDFNERKVWLIIEVIIPLTAVVTETKKREIIPVVLF